MAKHEPESGRKGHGLADHALGEDLRHRHDDALDHDHDHDEIDLTGRPEDNPLWQQDHVVLTTAGIDIGSSGTQVIFSRLFLRRLAEDLTSRYYVVKRETLFLSPIALTPYRSATEIDSEALRAVIDDAYRAAGVAPADIDTGAVILTGEALRRENAQAIAALIAQAGGDFVCATAGHHMESMLAAYGSGAAQASNALRTRILNIDIGGGTTKLALVEGGRVLATAALDIGGRLQVVDRDGQIVRLDAAGRTHARRTGFDWRIGDTVEDPALDAVAETMADALVAALSNAPLSEAIASLYLTEPLSDLSGIGGIRCSGGVAEYIYGREARDFGDMGRRLGRAFRRRLDAGALPWPLLPAGECIRATALGASEYSVQLSGNTSFISNAAALLPRRNLQVLRPQFEAAEEVDAAALAEAIRAHRRQFGAEAADAPMALALSWRGMPAYERIHAFATGIASGLADRIAAGAPLYIMVDGDVAQTLGAILREDCGVGSEILCIDGVVLMDFDYIDLGRLRVPSYTVPVTVKSLVFSDDPLRGRERLHHRAHELGLAHHHDGS